MPGKNLRNDSKEIILTKIDIEKECMKTEKLNIGNEDEQKMDTEHGDFDKNPTIYENPHIDHDMAYGKLDMNFCKDYESRTGEYANEQSYNNESFFDKQQSYFPYGYYPPQRPMESCDLMNQGLYHYDPYVYPPHPFHPYFYQGYVASGMDARKFKSFSIPSEDKQFYDPSIFMTDNQELEKKYMKCEKSGVAVKPPFSYSQLITKAIETSENGILTLSEIYIWIKNSFEYYRITDSTWQNSIRHNLSLNKMFKKVARPSNKPGKGGYWMIDYDYLANGTPRMKVKKRKIYDECRRRDGQSMIYDQKECEYEDSECEKVDITEIDFYNEYVKKNNDTM